MDDFVIESAKFGYLDVKLFVLFNTFVVLFSKGFNNLFEIANLIEKLMVLGLEFMVLFSKKFSGVYLG